VVNRRRRPLARRRQRIDLNWERNEPKMKLHASSASDLSAAVVEHSVQIVDVKFTDLFGQWHHFSLPAEDGLRHFGGGQTEVTLDLPKGRHTLQMLLGDHNHVPHVPPVASAVVTITVE